MKIIHKDATITATGDTGEMPGDSKANIRPALKRPDLRGQLLACIRSLLDA